MSLQCSDLQKYILVEHVIIKTCAFCLLTDYYLKEIIQQIINITFQCNGI